MFICGANASRLPSAPPEMTSSDRVGIITEIQNDVTARAVQTGEFIAAENGMSLAVGGGVQTGENGRACLDLQPEGTIVRVGPNSSFTMPEITFSDGQSKTRIELAVGEVFILLKGGSVDVETPSGVASVRGSLLNVRYRPDENKMIVTSVEGHCSLANDAGEVELTEGEASYIEGEDGPVDPVSMDQESVEEWLDEVPELDEFLDELPDVEDYPESSEQDDSLEEEPNSEQEGSERSLLAPALGFLY